MIRRDAVELELREWVHSQASRPAYLDDVLAVTARTPQRPAWAIPATWLPRPVSASRVVRLALLGALIAAALLGALLIAGALRDEEPVEAQSTNGAIAYPVNDERLRGADIVVVTPGREPQPLVGAPGDGADQACPSFSPDGTMLAYGELGRPVPGGRPSEIVIVSLAPTGTTVPVRRFPIGRGGGLSCPTWAPDGRAVAYIDHGERPGLWVAPLVGEPRRAWDDGPCCLVPNAFAWAHDGSRIVHLGVHSVESLPLERRDPRVLASAGRRGDLQEEFESLAASPNAPLVAIGGAWYRVEQDTSRLIRSFVRVVDTETGATAWEVDGLSHPTWSPDGTRIAASTGTGIRVLRADGSPVPMSGGPWTVPGVPGPVKAFDRPVWSPDGTRLVFIGWTEERDGEFALVSIAAEGPADAVALTPWSIALYNAHGRDLTWQPVFR